MSRKLTRNQQLVLNTLRREANALSAYAILDHLRPEGLRAPLQVYRALERLTETGHVHRIESRNAFIACRDRSHHGRTQDGKDRSVVFMLCDNCGRATEILDNALDDQLAALAAASGFHTRHRMVELRGLCNDCDEAASSHPSEGW